MATTQGDLLLLAPESPAFCFMCPCAIESVNRHRDWGRKGWSTRRGWSQDHLGVERLAGAQWASNSLHVIPRTCYQI